MTITAVKDVSATRSVCAKDIAPPRIHAVREAKFEGFVPIENSGAQRAQEEEAAHKPVALVIDLGSSAVRAGWSFDAQPRHSIPPIMAKYRDRKLNYTMGFAGADCYADSATRSHIRNAFEPGTDIVVNWDVVEYVLDWTFIKLGLNGEDADAIQHPIVMTEALANLGYSRRSMTEILFECYRAPSITYGVDSLFAYHFNNGSTGLVISSSYSATHVIPVYNSKPLLSQATRLNFGGYHASEYLYKRLRLKYPNFPGKLNISQCEYMLRDHCYVSTDFPRELASYLDWTGLEDRDVVIQYPFVEEVIVQKSEQELARIAERKKESGRRLQEQAAKIRLEKLMQKEQELEYLRGVHGKILAATNKKEVKRLLDGEEMRDESHLEKTIKELDKKIRKQRTKDLGVDVEEEAEPVFDLLDVPDDQLDDEQLKAKKQQRLVKANHDARARARAEKEAEKARVEEEKRRDRQRRDDDFAGWLEEKRASRANTIARIKERDRLKADLGNRKSLASQLRMKSIANLASDTPAGGAGEKRKRRNGGNAGDDDDFGANDDDWGVYRQIAVGPKDADEEEEDEDLDAMLKSQEDELLQHDPDFTEEHTHAAQSAWNRSLLHAFERGPWEFTGSQAEMNQLHLNVERIRIPEVVFQPAIAGIDQAGLGEIIEGLVTQRLRTAELRLSPSQENVLENVLLQDVFLTGGLTQWRNFDDRLRSIITPLMEYGKGSVGIRRAQDPLLDAWRGAAKWVSSDEWKHAQITREDYLEKGADYLKEHALGNSVMSLSI